MSLCLLFLQLASGAEVWSSVLDPQLSGFFEQMTENNGDLNASVQRVRSLESVKRAQFGALLPTVSVNGGSQITPFKSLGFAFGGLPTNPNVAPPTTYQVSNLTVNGAWTLDWTGRQWLGVRAARLEQRAASGDLEDVRLTLSALVASAYFDWIAAAQTGQIARRQLEESESLLQSVESRYGGDSGALDVLQQRQSIAGLRAALPRAAASEVAAAERLYALIGARPELSTASLPLPIYQPAEVSVYERPDVKAAAARSQAALLRKKASARSALPTLSVNAQAGWQLSKITVTKSQDTWGAGVALRVPLFAGGQVYEGYRQASFASASAASQLEQVRRAAEAEVRTAEAQERSVTEQLRAFDAQVLAARDAYQLAREHYVNGSVGFLSVQSASNAWLVAQLNQLNAARALVGARVQRIVASAGTLDFGVNHDRH